MADNLASNGYAVMSIEANVKLRQRLPGRRRQRALADHPGRPRLLDRWNNGTGPVTDDPDTTVGLKLVGQLSFRHRPDGPLARRRRGHRLHDLQRATSRAGSRYPLAAVLALAPIYYSLKLPLRGPTTPCCCPPATAT